MEDLLGAIQQESQAADLCDGLQKPDAVKNNPADYEVYTILLKVLKNIADHPGEMKFRTLKKQNKLVVELGRSASAISALLVLGFNESETTYHFPEDADIGPVEDAVGLLEAIVASYDIQAPEPAPAVAPAAATPTAGYPAAPAAAARPAAAAAAIAVGGTAAFTRRTDEGRKVEDQRGELQAARQAQQARHEQSLQAPAPAQAQMMADTKVADSKAAADTAKKPAAPAVPKSAFDFQNRAAQEAKQNSAGSSLQELRAAQRDKYKDFQADPTARQSEAYQRPPAVAAGGKVEQGWGEWVGSMFGGGSSSGGGGGGGGSNERRGPRMKTINDLPKPVQRG